MILELITWSGGIALIPWVIMTLQFIAGAIRDLARAGLRRGVGARRPGPSPPRRPSGPRAEPAIPATGRASSVTTSVVLPHDEAGGRRRAGLPGCRIPAHP